MTGGGVLRWAGSILLVIKDLPTEPSVVRKHRRSSWQPWGESKGFLPLPFLSFPRDVTPPSVPARSRVWSSWAPEEVVSRAHRSLCSGPSPYPDCFLPYNGPLHILFPFLPHLLWSLLPSRTPPQPQCWTCSLHDAAMNARPMCW